MGDDASLHDDLLKVASSGGYEKLPFLGVGQHRVHIVEPDVDPSLIREDPHVESSEAFLPLSPLTHFPGWIFAVDQSAILKSVGFSPLSLSCT